MDVIYEIDSLDNDYTFMLFGNCILTEGYSQNIISDLLLGKYIEVTKGLENLCQTKNLKELKLSTENIFWEPIVNFYNKLARLKFGFFTKIPEFFPRIGTDWEDAEIVSNAIIRYDGKNPIPLDISFQKLSDTLCFYIVLDISNLRSIVQFQEILTDIQKSNLCSVELYVQYQADVSDKELFSILAKQMKVISLTLYNAENDEIIDIGNDIQATYMKSSSNIFDHCGAVEPALFDTRDSHFLESMHRNTCLNKKLTIDSEGNIKSCPVMPQVFGNIKDANLHEVVNNTELQKIWNIKKDDIEVCKDCEYRHICTDCRGHIVDTENIHSKPSKCKYNPYTGKWEND